MTNKIKSAYKLLAKQLLLPITIIVPLVFLMQLKTYYDDKSATPDLVSGVSTQEFFLAFFVGVYLAILMPPMMKLMLGLGTSRKSIFISNMLFYLSVSPIISITNLIIFKVFRNTQKFSCIFRYVYENRYTDMSDGRFLAEYYLWQITLFLMCCLLFYMVLTLFMRLGKKGKILFFGLFAVSPVVVVTTFASTGVTTDFFTKLYHSVTVNGTNPLPLILLNLFAAVIFGVVSYLIFRRSPVNK